MDDDELFKRFNALKAPSHNPGLPRPDSNSDSVDAPRDAKQFLETRAADAKREDEYLSAIAEGRPLPGILNTHKDGHDEDEELQKRIRRLKGEQDVDDDDDGDDGAGDLNDAEVEAYLASLSSSKPPESEAGALENEDSLTDAMRKATDPKLDTDAQSALDEAASHGIVPDATDAGTVKGEKDDEDTEYCADEDLALDDEETEEEIISRALAEAALEKDKEVDKELQSDNGDDEGHADQPNESPGELSFPSLPTHIPMSDHEETGSEPVDEDTKKRMDLLLGLSGPAQRPEEERLPEVPKRAPGLGWNLPGYDDSRDNDLDSWCCICNKDAELICLGCDDDLYCVACWNEGHEFEKHRVKKFTWNRKQAMGS